MSSLFADTHNVVAILKKSDAAEGFEQIIDFLMSPHIYISCIKQFWNSVLVKRTGDVTRLQALVDKKKIVISEAVIREILQLNDAEGMVCLPNEEIFAGLAQMRVKKLEKINMVKSSKLRRLKKVGTSQRVDSSYDMENVFNQGRIIVDMDQDKGIKLVANQEKDAKVEGRHADKQAELYNLDQDHSSKVLSMQEDDTEVQEAVEIVTTAKLMNEVVTAATTQVVAASTPIPAAKPKILNIAAAPAVSTRRRKGVVIRDPEEELPSNTPAETPKYIKRYHGMKKKPRTESEARKNIILYLKNTKGYKMDFFKGKKYDEILPIFQAKFDANMRTSTGGGDTSCAAAAPASTTSAPSPSAGTTNMGAKRGIWGPSQFKFMLENNLAVKSKLELSPYEGLIDYDLITINGGNDVRRPCLL
nr:hypothetical protein [Tanacetum cinerariifolium]